MDTLTFISGTRRVIASRNGMGHPWSSRLYLNNGESAGLQCAKHQTAKGARKWAATVLGCDAASFGDASKWATLMDQRDVTLTRAYEIARTLHRFKAA